MTAKSASTVKPSNRAISVDSFSFRPALVASAFTLLFVNFYPLAALAEDPLAGTISDSSDAAGMPVSDPSDAAGLGAAPDGGAPAAAGALLPNEKCVCDEKPPLPKLLERSTLSFVGRVEKTDNNPRRAGFTEVTFVVLNRFKGFDEVRTPKVLIYTPKEESCSYGFRVGLDYMVFASGTPAFFKVDSCSGSEVLENAYTDVERVKRMTANDPSNKMPSDGD
jgi:hypothetical protein